MVLTLPAPVLCQSIWYLKSLYFVTLLLFFLSLSFSFFLNFIIKIKNIKSHLNLVCPRAIIYGTDFDGMAHTVACC